MRAEGHSVFAQKLNWPRLNQWADVGIGWHEVDDSRLRLWGATGGGHDSRCRTKPETDDKKVRRISLAAKSEITQSM